MTIVPRLLLLVWLVAAVGGACGAAAGTPVGGAAGVSGGASCDHDGCVVPLSQAAGICPATFVEAGANCPGVTRRFSDCAPFRYVHIVTVGPSHDCYYDQSDGLVGAVLRSDAGFTKVAGNVPTQTCPAANVLLCDHSTAGGTGGSGGVAGTWGGGGTGGGGGTFADPSTQPCEIADGIVPVPDGGTDGGVACPSTGIVPGGSCPSARLQCGSCTCHVCRFNGGELYLNRWGCD